MNREYTKESFNVACSAYLVGTIPPDFLDWPIGSQLRYIGRRKVYHLRSDAPADEILVRIENLAAEIELRIMATGGDND